jgi:hypothetical protein
MAMTRVPIPSGYVDTCIVSGMAKGDLSAADLSALRRILEAREAGTIELVTSDVTKREIDQIPPQYRAPHEAIYELLARVPVAPSHLTATRLVNTGVTQGAWREDPLFGRLRNLLPDVADAEHIFQTARNGVDFFVTVDRRTILRHKAEVEAVCQLQLATPASFENDALGGCNGDG